MENQLSPGDPAPLFELENARGERVKLSDFAGQRVLLYFYPKADTPGCTIQSCAVRDAQEPLAGADVVPLGISPDDPPDLAKFDEKFSLGFALLSDPEHTVAEAYGVWGEKSMYGRTYMGIVRSAFLVDPQGRIEQAWYKVSPKKTIPNTLAALKS
jgi:peroxiredoxin Q/BCP